MDTEQVLRDQKEELEKYSNDGIIRREIENYFSKVTDSTLIKVVTGIRRCGKSVLIYLMIKDKNFAYVNFDDDRLLNKSPDEILSAFYKIYGTDFKFMFLDEVQNLDNWELFVNRLHRTKFNVFITGSNSRLLSKELSTHLTGRHIKVELFPFSFREYLDAKKFSKNPTTTKEIAICRKHLQDYIKNGGFPEIVVNAEPPSIYLKQLYLNIIERDIIWRYEINYKKTFKEITQTILNNPGTNISYNKLKKQFNLGSEHTVKNYLSYLEESYIIFLLNRFSHKPIEIEKSDKKVYVIDTGIISSVTNSLSSNIGRLYENIVAIELLRKKAFDNKTNIYYWKNITHEEVDFVITENSKIKKLIHVCYNLENQDTKARETTALIKASKELNCNELMIITSDYETQERIKNKTIKYIPLWKWLLQSE